MVAGCRLLPGCLSPVSVCEEIYALQDNGGIERFGIFSEGDLQRNYS